MLDKRSRRQRAKMGPYFGYVRAVMEVLAHAVRCLIIDCRGDL
jgi:hypothetical protein